MPTILKDLGHWFWRLVPANPILVRVVASGSKRAQHLFIRLGYLLVLAVAVCIGVIFTSSSGASLADLAKNATFVFKHVSAIQLFMVCVIAPIFASSAITQEKNSQTYNILLSTPLSNGQIVLGSLLSRLYFVFALLLAGIPLFCIMMVYGGVTGDKIAQSIALAAATALLTGTLAIAISVVKIGTGRTIFTFYMAIAIYLIVVYALGSRTLIPPEAEPAPGKMARMSWLAAVHPFLALDVVMGETPAPEYGAVAHYGSVGAFILSAPHYAYVVGSALISAALIVLSLFFVRRGAKEGEPTFFSRIFGREVGSAGHVGRPEEEGSEAGGRDASARQARTVRKNPIAWRESVTSAAAGGGVWTRYALYAAGLILALVLLVNYGTKNFNVADTREWLYLLVVTEVFIALFIATTTAATSMTREKESNTLELILATPLTSEKIITGKIRGLVNAAGPMLIVPYVTVGLFVLFDLVSGRMRSAQGPVAPMESLITMPVLLVAFTAFACMIGLSASIKNKKTLGAVFSSMFIIMAVFGLTTGCAFGVQGAGDTHLITAFFMPITPVTACLMAIDPETAISGGTRAIARDMLTASRTVAFIAAFCSAAVYMLVGYQLRSSMVRNFDMIIRKQTA